MARTLSPVSTQTIEAAETHAVDPHPRRWHALALLGVAQFMLNLDVTVVNIALPSIGADLSLNRATLTWVVSAYTLVFGGLLLLGGRAAELFGARRVSMAGLALFTGGPGWQWASFINVPVGLVILAALPLVPPGSPAAGRRSGLDLSGAVLATAATGLAIYGLISAGDRGWVGRWTVLPILAAALLYVGFVAAQRVVRSPLLDLRILVDRSMLAGGLLILAVTGLMIACFFLGSFYLRQQRGFSPMATGLLFLPVALGTMAGAQNAGRLLTRLGGRAATVVSLAQVVVGMAIAGLWTSPTVVVVGITVAATFALVTAVVAAVAMPNLRPPGAQR